MIMAFDNRTLDGNPVGQFVSPSNGKTISCFGLPQVCLRKVNKEKIFISFLSRNSRAEYGDAE